jgi:hypothetical protein
LDIVDGSSPSETEEEPATKVSGRRARIVGALATLDSFAPTVGAKKDRKRLMFIHLY